MASLSHVLRTDRRRHGRQRGTTVIEAAIITPVLFSLILGIIEIGLASNDYLGLSNAVRAGSRTASASGPDLPADWGTLVSIERDASALARRDIKQIVIYKATSIGEDPTTTCQNGTPVSGVCNVYTVADFARDKDEFGCKTTSPDRFWCPTSRKVTVAGTGTDYIGVWMKVDHRWVTKMFGTARTFTDSSVIRLEPRLSR